MPKSKKVLKPGQVPGGKAGKLTDQQERFCNEYIIDLNATQAAIRSSYGVKGADSMGSQLLSNPKVAARILELKKERGKRTKVDQDRVVREISRVAFADVGDFFQFDDANKDLKFDAEAFKKKRRSRGLTGFKTSPGEYGTTYSFTLDKLGALEKLAKHVGLYDSDPGSDSGSSELDLGTMLVSVRRLRAS